MLFKINCPKCGADGSMSLVESSYNGPYRCWKCRELFMVSLENGGLKSYEPMSQEEFQKRQEMEALKSKFKRPGG